MLIRRVTRDTPPREKRCGGRYLRRVSNSEQSTVCLTHIMQAEETYK